MATFQPKSLIRIGGGVANEIGKQSNVWLYVHTAATKAEMTTAAFFATAGGTLNSDNENEGNDDGDTGQLQLNDVIIAKHSTGWSLLEISSAANAAAGTASFVTLVTS